MAVDSNDPIDGHPIFLDASAPDVAVNATKVAEYAAKVGTRLLGPTADRTAWATAGYAREGLRWRDTTNGYEYEYTGGGWVVVRARLRARMKRSTTAKSVSDSTWNQDLSANANWDQDFRDAGIAAYSNGWTIPFAGDWAVELGIALNVAGTVGITVNASTVSSYTDFVAYASAPAVQAAGLAQTTKTLPLASGDVVRVFGVSGSGSATWLAAPTGLKLSWFGIRYVGP